MNHPSREEFVPYIFGEADADVSRRLRDHLNGCLECREEVERWKRSLGRLDAWKLPRASRAREVLQPVLRWAAAGAAAAAVLVAAFAAGRLSAPRLAPVPVRGAIAAEVREQLRQEFDSSLNTRLAETASGAVASAGDQTRELLRAYAVAAEAKRAEEDRALYLALDQLESRWQAQRVADYIALKKDLDTVAVNTDAGLRQLADARRSGTSASRSKNISIKN